MGRHEYECRRALAMVMLILSLTFNNDTVLGIRGVPQLVLEPLPQVTPSRRSLPLALRGTTCGLGGNCTGALP